MQPVTAHKIRTIWFLTAMIPLIVIVGILGAALLGHNISSDDLCRYNRKTSQESLAEAIA